MAANLTVKIAGVNDEPSPSWDLDEGLDVPSLTTQSVNRTSHTSRVRFSAPTMSGPPSFARWGIRRVMKGPTGSP